MPESVAEVQNTSQSTFMLVPIHHPTLNFTGLGDDSFQMRISSVKKVKTFLFQYWKKFRIFDEGSFDDFGKPVAPGVRGKRGQNVNIGEHKPRLMEGA